MSYDESLANQIKEYPAQYIPLFEEVVESVARQSGLISSNVPGFQVMVLSRANSIPLRALDVSYCAMWHHSTGAHIYTCYSARLPRYRCSRS